MSRDLTSLPPVFLDLDSVPEFSWIPFVDYSFWKICVLRLVIIGFSSRLHLHHWMGCLSMSLRHPVAMIFTSYLELFALVANKHLSSLLHLLLMFMSQVPCENNSCPNPSRWSWVYPCSRAPDGQGWGTLWHTSLFGRWSGEMV